MTSALLKPCDICSKHPGMTDGQGQHLCPRCGRELHLGDLMAEHLDTTIKAHVMPHLQEVLKTWAGYWIATGLLEDRHAAGIAEYGLSLAFGDLYKLAHTLEEVQP